MLEHFKFELDDYICGILTYLTADDIQSNKIMKKIACIDFHKLASYKKLKGVALRDTTIEKCKDSWVDIMEKKGWLVNFYHNRYDDEVYEFNVSVAPIEKDE